MSDMPTPYNKLGFLESEIEAFKFRDVPGYGLHKFLEGKQDDGGDNADVLQLAGGVAGGIAGVGTSMGLSDMLTTEDARRAFGGVPPGDVLPNRIGRRLANPGQAIIDAGSRVMPFGGREGQEMARQTYINTLENKHIQDSLVEAFGEDSLDISGTPTAPRVSPAGRLAIDPESGQDLIDSFSNDARNAFRNTYDLDGTKLEDIEDLKPKTRLMGLRNRVGEGLQAAGRGLQSFTDSITTPAVREGIQNFVRSAPRGLRRLGLGGAMILAPPAGILGGEYLGRHAGIQVDRLAGTDRPNKKYLPGSGLYGEKLRDAYDAGREMLGMKQSSVAEKMASYKQLKAATSKVAVDIDTLRALADQYSGAGPRAAMGGISGQALEDATNRFMSAYAAGNLNEDPSKVMNTLMNLEDRTRAQRDSARKAVDTQFRQQLEMAKLLQPGPSKPSPFSSGFQGQLGKGLGSMVTSPLTGIGKGVEAALSAPGTTYGYRLNKAMNSGMQGLMNRIQAPDVAAKKFIETSAGRMADSATSLLADMSSKAVSGLTDAMVNAPARKAILNQLRAEDDIISQMGEQELMDAYHSIAKFAPTLARDKNAVRSTLRMAAQSEGGLSPHTIKQLADTELSIIKSRQQVR